VLGQALHGLRVLRCGGVAQVRRQLGLRGGAGGQRGAGEERFRSPGGKALSQDHARGVRACGAAWGCTWKSVAGERQLCGLYGWPAATATQALEKEAGRRCRVTGMPRDDYESCTRGLCTGG
jgi:hypothetical protein